MHLHRESICQRLRGSSYFFFFFKTWIQSVVKFWKSKFTSLISFEALLTNEASLFSYSVNSSPPAPEDRNSIGEDRDKERETDCRRKMCMSADKLQLLEGHILALEKFCWRKNGRD